jgi:hypothetical protein
MRYFKLNCLTLNTEKDRVLRKEWDEIYAETTFGTEADQLLAENKLVEVKSQGKSSKEASKKQGGNSPNTAGNAASTDDQSD